MTALEPAQVLEPGQRTLRELADEANREHALVLETGAAMVEHAIRAGDALLRMEAAYIEQAAQMGGSRWLDVLDTSFDGAVSTAQAYMRLARYQDAIRASGVDSVNRAKMYLAEIGAKSPMGAGKAPPDWLIGEMRRLLAAGWSLSAVGRHLGMSRHSVKHWTASPEERERARQRSLKEWRRRQAAANAIKAQARERAIKQAVRKRGGAIAKLYADAERTQDDIAQAQREASDPEARRELSEAGELHRQYRDKIVRALGVS